MNAISLCIRRAGDFAYRDLIQNSPTSTKSFRCTLGETKDFILLYSQHSNYDLTQITQSTSRKCHTLQKQFCRNQDSSEGSIMSLRATALPATSELSCHTSVPEHSGWGPPQTTQLVSVIPTEQAKTLVELLISKYTIYLIVNTLHVYTQICISISFINNWNPVIGIAGFNLQVNYLFFYYTPRTYYWVSIVNCNKTELMQH